MIGDELVSRDEFINMMMAMRSELMAINARLDELQAASGEKTMIKVQQIPLEPKQHVMEEVFKVRFDFNKSINSFHIITKSHLCQQALYAPFFMYIN